MSEIMLARAVMPITVLAAEEKGDKGLIEALVSVYNVRYRMGMFRAHLIRPGAFAKSAAEQPAVPLFWMHNWDWTEQPPIGHAVASEVTSPTPGLKIAGELYLDQPGVTPIFRALKARALREWSIGYKIQAEEKDENDDTVSIITQAVLLEASSVLRGANPETQTLKVASAAAGVRALSQAAAALTIAVHELSGMADGADDTPEPVHHEQATVCPKHSTSAVEGTWDADTHVGRLPSPMPLATVNRMYGWYDNGRVVDGTVVKAACKLPHHQVSTDGRPGAAMLNGVRNALARLPQSNIPAMDHAAIRGHLQAHLDAAASEPDVGPPDSGGTSGQALAGDGYDPEVELRRAALMMRRRRMEAR